MLRHFKALIALLEIADNFEFVRVLTYALRIALDQQYENINNNLVISIYVALK